MYLDSHLFSHPLIFNFTSRSVSTNPHKRKAEFSLDNLCPSKKTQGALILATEMEEYLREPDISLDGDPLISKIFYFLLVFFLYNKRMVANKKY